MDKRKDDIMFGPVELRNNTLVVSSKRVADDFNKEHKHVLDSIREYLTAENSAVKNWFFESHYITNRGRRYPMYLMTRNGFALLAMGFTTQKALEWKIKYIKAFEYMENELRKHKYEKIERENRRLISLEQEIKGKDYKIDVNEPKFRNKLEEVYRLASTVGILADKLRKSEITEKIYEGYWHITFSLNQDIGKKLIELRDISKK
ncbi:Rha family transcriptional regulator [Megamonas funiformis]|jgi:Rha family phage regulatory protein|uniref:Regulatory protein n=2 Tax=root TaxID=1 RepID=A0A8S5MF57_9CAUD|nr:Rha family transcriptional regulator [Megamonas funiformis]DAD80844.1 MAG TPA: regulatory protein [Siphoviridae sp. ctmAU6]DAL51183.1 MAG TPA_asm: regulatory protein [Caudoviricetes sp.]